MKISYLKYFFALLLFGTNGIVASFIDLNSYEIVLFRTLIGSALLVFLFLLGRNKFTFYKNKKHFSFLFISGIAMGLSWMLIYEAYALNRCKYFFFALLLRPCNRYDVVPISV